MWSFDQTAQYVAWFIALIDVIVGLYVLYLNSSQTGNRHVGMTLFIQAAIVYALGSLVTSQNEADAQMPIVILSSLLAAIIPILLLTSVSLLRPRWMHDSNTTWIKTIIRLVAVMPLLLTLLDVWSGAGIYFTGLDQATYGSGLVEPSVFNQGPLTPVVHLFNYGVMGILMLVFLLYVGPFNRQASSRTKGIALWIMAVNLFAALPGSLITGLRPFFVASIISSGAILITYGYAAFQEMVSERRLQRSSLTARLTVLFLIVSIPLLAGLAIFLTEQARTQLEANVSQSLEASNHSALESTEVWLSYNNRALKMLSLNESIISMDPQRQEPVLRSIVSTYSNLYLSSTTTLDGRNLARSDGRELLDYSDRFWFQQSAAGRPIAYQVVVGRTGGQPALVIAMPIRNVQDNSVVGVVMSATELDQVARLISQANLTPNSQVYLVNDSNLVLTHTDPAVLPGTDFSDNPAIKLLRGGYIGAVQFTDASGLRWQAYGDVLSNGWGLVVQQDEATLLAPIRAYQGLGLVSIIVGGITLLVLTLAATRQALRPIRSLTDTAAAITGGDIGRVAPIESQDELGLLAEAFNAMTAQMRDLINGLESRVSERTRDLERRALQLQVTAEVAREAAAIRDLNQLLSQVTRLVSERLGHYHVGIFMLEGGDEVPADAKNYLAPKNYLGTRPGALAAMTESGDAVLKATNSEGGQHMLARGHRLKVGQVGIVGYVASAGQPRIALDVGRDAVFFNNPDLPLTRSEVALPLKIQNRVIGVLDVQSRRASAFNEDDLAILQILADQVALAIENARLIEESRQTVSELESLYGMQINRGWEKRLGHQPLVYALQGNSVETQPRQESKEPRSSTTPLSAPDSSDLLAPIDLRGHRLGRLHLRRPPEAGPWSDEEIELVTQATAQLAQSLENARLLEEIQNRARQEEQMNLIVTRTQSSLNLEAVMRTAVQELAQALNLGKVRLRLSGEDGEAASGNGDSPRHGHDHPADNPSSGPEPLTPSPETEIQPVVASGGQS